MSPQESLDRIVQLLGALPGIVVDKHWCAEGIAHIHFSAEALDSLAVIVRHATFSNCSVKVNFVGPPGPPGGQSEVHKLRFQLAFNTVEDIPPSMLQVFGIFLVRHLKAVGLVPPQIANDLQQQWNAVVI